MDTVTLLREAQGVYKDAGRDRVPENRVWEMIDFLPRIAQSAIRGRGPWRYRSDALPNDISGLLFAPYKAGDRLIAINGTDVRSILLGAVGSTSIGSAPATLQNPVFYRDRVIIPAADGVTVAKYIAFNGAYTFSDGPAQAVGRYATIFKDRLTLGNTNAQPQRIAFAKPGDPTLAFDALSIIDTQLPLTGLAQQRTQILAFHSGSVERLRGTTPPDSTASDPTGDMQLDFLWDRAGCIDARSIAYWNDNVIFGDARGVHVTDGAIVRNMVVQGGIESQWRTDMERDTLVTLAGGVVRDLYWVTIRSATGVPITWVCDIPTRYWYRMSNVDAAAYAYSIGSTERFFATKQSAKRVIELTEMLKPAGTQLVVDDDGTAVLPVIETGWNRLSKREGRKRVIDILIAYEADADGSADVFDVDILLEPDGAYENTSNLKRGTGYTRRKINVRRDCLGIAFRLQQLVQTRDTRLYDIAAVVQQLDSQKQQLS